MNIIPASIRKRLSVGEQLRYFMISGGIPRYLEVFDFAQSREDNLLREAYSESGYLFREFDTLMKDLFRTKGERAKRILNALAEGKQTAASLANNLDSLLGLQFEYVMRENPRLVYQALSINSEDVIKMAPYQTKGLQTDLLIETRRYFYIVEMKFQLTPLAMDGVSSMKDKLERFPCPANKSVRTAIIHVNGAQEKLENSDYIDICCNLSDLLA